MFGHEHVGRNFVEWSRAAKDKGERAEVVFVHQRVSGEEVQQRGNDGDTAYPISLSGSFTIANGKGGGKNMYGDDQQH